MNVTVPPHTTPLLFLQGVSTTVWIITRSCVAGLMMRLLRFILFTQLLKSGYVTVGEPVIISAVSATSSTTSQPVSSSHHSNKRGRDAGTFSFFSSSFSFFLLHFYSINSNNLI